MSVLDNDRDLFSNSLVVDVIKSVFNCKIEDIESVSKLKKGMTNDTYSFNCFGEKYLVRIPGSGTSRLIDRHQEYAVYETIRGTGICDDPVYINAENGFKITKYLHSARTCDIFNENDLLRCMRLLKRFHDMDLKVPHRFDLFKHVDFYEALWNGKDSAYPDYNIVKKRIFTLREFIDSIPADLCLAHIDAVPDNFLFYYEDENEKLQLTDWEYSAMQDPHVDIAMFCIYSMYDRFWTDRLIDIYFDGDCDDRIRTKIYCYMAVCGLIWSNWCEYKRLCGVEFGRYAIKQYEYAKEYYDIVKQMIR